MALTGARADWAAPLSYLRSNAQAVSDSATGDGGAAAKAVLALALAGEDPGDFEGHDLAQALTLHLSPVDPAALSPYNHGVALLALAAAGEPIPAEAVSSLRGRQAAEGEMGGSWDDGFGTAGNPDSTALAISGLLAAGLAPDDTALVAARDFLSRSQLATGGWEYGPGLGENANSTALATMALIRLGEDILTPGGEWEREGRSPGEALLSWQAVSGAFQADFGAGRADDFFSTVQAIPVLAALAARPGANVLEEGPSPAVASAATVSPPGSAAGAAPTAQAAGAEDEGNGATTAAESAAISPWLFGAGALAVLLVVALAVRRGRR
jgi:hypothetical protein